MTIETTGPDASPAAPLPEAAAAVQQMLGGPTAASLLYVAVELGLPDLLVAGPSSAAALAVRTGAQPDALERVLRALAVLGVLRYVGEEGYALAPLGAALRADVPGSLRPAARLMGHPATLRAWSSLLHTVLSGEPAFNHAHGRDMLAYADADLDLATRFNSFMGGITRQVTPLVVAAYDFGQVGTLVDVGGGDGSLARAILRAYPATRGIIFDRPHARAQAEAAIVADGLAERCEFVSGDFFAAVPAGADAYLLKSVIHDWDAARSVTILATCRRAMARGSRLLLVERAVPATGLPSPDVVMSDLTMLAMTSGRERTEAAFRALLAEAGLTLRRVIPTAGGPDILEATIA